MAKSIMIQGTMSNAGKSLLAGGLCRVFHQDGHKVAPFKSQNMALNSFITDAGFEMGRAQVMQAEAAGIAPDVRMNPILLKPTGDMGSQVIVNGEVLGNMKAAEYYAYKHNLRPAVRQSVKPSVAQPPSLLFSHAVRPDQRPGQRSSLLSAPQGPPGPERRLAPDTPPSPDRLPAAEKKLWQFRRPGRSSVPP